MYKQSKKDFLSILYSGKRPFSVSYPRLYKALNITGKFLGPTLKVADKAAKYTIPAIAAGSIIFPGSTSWIAARTFRPWAKGATEAWGPQVDRIVQQNANYINYGINQSVKRADQVTQSNIRDLKQLISRADNTADQRAKSILTQVEARLSTLSNKLSAQAQQTGQAVGQRAAQRTDLIIQKARQASQQIGQKAQERVRQSSAHAKDVTDKAVDSNINKVRNFIDQKAKQSREGILAAPKMFSNQAIKTVINKTPSWAGAAGGAVGGALLERLFLDPFIDQKKKVLRRVLTGIAGAAGGVGGYLGTRYLKGVTGDKNS